MLTSRSKIVSIGLISCSAWVCDGHATIYLCTDAQGNRLYTDHGCTVEPQAGVKRLTAEIYTPAEQPAVAFAPLTESERQRLRQLSDYKQPSRQRSARSTADREVTGGRDAQACLAARTALKQLRQRRRAGFKLDETTDMEAQEAHWKAQRRRAC